VRVDEGRSCVVIVEVRRIGEPLPLFRSGNDSRRRFCDYVFPL